MRTFNSLSPHNQLYLSLDLFLEGVWTISDSASLVISDNNGHIFNEQILEFANINTDPNQPLMTCNNNMKSVPITLTTIIPHNTDSLSLKLTCHAHNSPESFCGIRNLKLLLSSRENIQEASCIITTPFDLKSPCDQYPLSNQFLNPPKKCDSSCESCFGPEPNQCLSCAPGYSYNGQQCTQCDKSCETCSGPSKNQCLSCPSDRFFTKEGVCHPYQLETQSSRILAACTHADFISPDGLSCWSECPFPFVTLVSAGVKTCYPPCGYLTGYYYYTDEALCVSSCLEPYIPTFGYSIWTCDFTKDREGVDIFVLLLDIMNRIGLILFSLFVTGDPFPLIVIGTAKMFQYVKFLGINFEPNLLRRFRFQDYNSISLSFGPNGGQSLKNQFSHKHVPLGFSRWGLLTSFIYNFWQYFISMIIMFGLIGILKGLIWVSKYKSIKWLPMNTLKIGEKMAWNFSVIFMYSLLIDIFMFAFLEWAFTYVSSVSDGLSFCFGIIFFGILCKILWHHSWFIRKLFVARKLPKDKSELEIQKLEKQYDNLQIIYKGVKTDELIKQSYLLIYTVRLLIFGLLIATLTEHPLASILLINLISCLMLAYLFLRRPLKSKFAEIIQFIYEIMLLVYNICVLSLAGLDNSQSPSESTQKGIGVFLLVIKIIFNFTVLGFLIYKLLMAYLQQRKQAEYRRRGVPVSERRKVPNQSQPSQLPASEIDPATQANSPDVPQYGQIDPGASASLLQPFPADQDGLLKVSDMNKQIILTEPPTSYRMNQTSMMLNPGDRSFIEDDIPMHQRASQSNYILPNPTNQMQSSNSNPLIKPLNLSQTQNPPINQNAKSTITPTPVGGIHYEDVTLGKRPRAMLDDDDLEAFASMDDEEDLYERITSLSPSVNASSNMKNIPLPNLNKNQTDLGSPINRKSLESKNNIPVPLFKGITPQEVLNTNPTTLQTSQPFTQNPENLAMNNKPGGLIYNNLKNLQNNTPPSQALTQHNQQPTKLPEQPIPSPFNISNNANNNPLNPTGSSAYKPAPFDESALKVISKPGYVPSNSLTTNNPNNLQLKPGASDFNPTPVNLNKMHGTPAFSNQVDPSSPNETIKNPYLPVNNNPSSPIKNIVEPQKPSQWDTKAISLNKSPEPKDMLDMLKAQHTNDMSPTRQQTPIEMDPYNNPNIPEIKDIASYLMNRPNLNEWGLSRALNRGKEHEGFQDTSEDMSPGKGSRGESLYVRQMRMKRKVGAAMKFNHLANAGGLILNQGSTVDLNQNANQTNQQNNYIFPR